MAGQAGSDLLHNSSIEPREPNFLPHKGFGLDYALVPFVGEGYSSTPEGGGYDKSSPFEDESTASHGELLPYL